MSSTEEKIDARKVGESCWMNNGGLRNEEYVGRQMFFDSAIRDPLLHGPSLVMSARLQKRCGRGTKW